MKRKMDHSKIIQKFGDHYLADENTFKMGIDYRFTTPIAERFKNKIVLETCTGAGFSTLALARRAKRVITVEINRHHQDQARKNIDRAGLNDKVEFKIADILDKRLLSKLPPMDAAFLDPDWAVLRPNHIFKFINSNTQPPADKLFETIFKITHNIALILPPQIDTGEFKALPGHERQKLYLDNNHELFCLYFGELALSYGETELRINN